jgi:hypothetical protein
VSASSGGASHKEKLKTKAPADSSTELSKTEMGDLIVKYLMPYYKEGRVREKDDFKTLARDMSHKAVKHKLKSEFCTSYGL